MIQETLDKTLENRKVLLKYLSKLTDEQLATIPAGFNNNIFWNIAHVVITQQLLMYKLSGLPMMVSDEIVDRYRKGSKPENGVIPEGDKALIEDLLERSILKAKEDVKAAVFKEYHTYTTSANVTLASIEDAVVFNYFHEGIHFGSVLALAKLV
jgi:hypothetical protein